LGSGGNTTRSDVDFETKAISVKKRKKLRTGPPPGRQARTVYLRRKNVAPGNKMRWGLGASGKLGEVFRDVVVENTKLRV
jgi:hypothetical protein